MKAATEREETIFYAALKLSNGDDRRLFLDQACAGDTELRQGVEQLLTAQDEADRFFKEGSSALQPLQAEAGVVPADAAALPEEQPGTRVGPYKLLQKIGEGGCGVVYMAEQEQPVRRRVALKVIKLGMDTRNVIARFEAERQALALMDHPNIARVLDAGATQTGRPYFVMELVRGVKITEYCDQNNVDTRQRLELFIQICHAIQHAHQKGIIHRDVKPSNILVTMHDGVPVPKVIDFGIAKATGGRLTDRTLFTAYEQLIGTPAYMSPEQAEMSGLDVDTRSDIYSLGVLLYELLTGRTPFDNKELLRSGLDEMRRTLREREPFRPSTMVTTLQGEELSVTAHHRQAEPPKLISLLKGDLDWIAMKALEKDRRRRYETANALAMDLEHYLHNEPVTARPPSRLYRFQKLVRRNRMAFSAAAAVSLALIAGMSTTTWMFLREREAHRRAVIAEQQQTRLRQEAEAARRQAETREKITQANVQVNQDRLEDADLLMMDWLMRLRQEAQAARRQADARENVTQTTARAVRSRLDDADLLVDDLFLNRPTVEGASVFRALGEWHALQNRWQEAADRFSVLLKINDLDSPDTVTLDYLECGPALIELGDTNRYQRFRQDAVNRFTGTSYPFADRIVKVSLLLPADPQFVESLRPMAVAAERTVTTTNSSMDYVFQAAWRSLSLGLLEYRRGQHAKAIAWCERCLAYPENNAPRTATAHVVLAMAHHRLGDTDRAQSELAAGRELIENRFKIGLQRGTGAQGFWFDWVFARILLQEAGALVQPSYLRYGGMPPGTQ